jgi:hypothetical protein
MSKEVTITFDVRGYEAIEVPNDWEWDGTLDSLLTFTDLKYNGQELLDLQVHE